MIRLLAYAFIAGALLVTAPWVLVALGLITLWRYAR